MLEQGKQYSASDFLALKAKVKAEMLRRCYEGSLAAYGGADYDFTTAKGEQLLAEHVNKIIGPMNQINDTGFTTQNIGDPAMALSELDAIITSYSEAPLDGTGHMCNASCSGLCSTGCAGSCGGGCSTGCGGTCKGGCGGCDGSCVGTCQGRCTGSCKDTCSGGCTASCQAGCALTCEDGCTQSCMASCGFGCGSACSSGCSSSCSTNCSGFCKDLTN